MGTKRVLGGDHGRGGRIERFSYSLPNPETLRKHLTLYEKHAAAK